MKLQSDISVCGADCQTCYLKAMCQGCNACQGKVFHCAEGEKCSIYRCVRDEKALPDCGCCPEAPCNIWMKTRDPSYSDDAFQANIRERMARFPKVYREANRRLADEMLSKLAPLGDVRRIAMMGGYIFYYREKIIAILTGRGILMKDVPAAREAMPDARIEAPYDGAKPMLHLTLLGDEERLRAMVEKMYPELPERKVRKKRTERKQQKPEAPLD